VKAILVFLAGSVAGLILPNLQWKGAGKSDLPAVFQEVRTMGVLRTAEVEASQVVAAESAIDAPQAVSWIIGVPQTLSALTKSEVGVQVTGRIEAGVDLSQAEFEQTSSGVLVRLPKAVIAPGPSRTELLWSRESWLNRDRELPIKAQEQGRELLARSARSSQLLQTAERQAEQLIRGILADSGVDHVTVAWKSGSQSN